jgi:hypothetical protein
MGLKEQSQNTNHCGDSNCDKIVNHYWRARAWLLLQSFHKSPDMQ